MGVWPEGYKGIGKPWKERYRLQRFGRGGFIARRCEPPRRSSRWRSWGPRRLPDYRERGGRRRGIVGLPDFRITPFFPWLGPLGLISLPSKWIVEFGDPIATASLDPAAGQDPMPAFNQTDRIRDPIQQTLYQLPMQRRSVFF